jgi:hypothetical protein
MGAGDFGNQAVGAKQAKLSAHPSGTAAGVFGVGKARKEDGSQIAIAEAIEGELATADGF